jgi:hypothetical protein
MYSDLGKELKEFKCCVICALTRNRKVSFAGMKGKLKYCCII